MEDNIKQKECVLIRISKRICFLLNRNKIELFKLNIQIVELMERLRLTQDDEVVKQTYQESKSMFEFEKQRSVHIDSKAASLLSACGFSITLLFTVGGLTIDKIKNIPIGFMQCPVKWFAAMCAICSILIAFTMFMCMLAMKARKDFRTLSENELFNKDAIKERLEHYQRFMATSYWKFFVINFRINNNKASKLSIAQVIFTIAIVGFTLIAMLFAYYAFYRGVT
jgi:hypothetical protein